MDELHENPRVNNAMIELQHPEPQLENIIIVISVRLTVRRPMVTIRPQSRTVKRLRVGRVKTWA
jgi:hypothetical protein